MADIIDNGNDAAEMFLTAALSQRSEKEVPTYTGHCHNCDKEVEPPRRWCDVVCRDEWEEHNK